MKKHPITIILVTLAVALGACVTHIKTSVTHNPPPAEKFSAFTKFEISKVELAPPYAGQEANEKALVKIQENVSHVIDTKLGEWNAIGASSATTRTLLIEPKITEIKFISGAPRFWVGPFAGSSAVILTANITEKESGEVIASPIFYARAAAMSGAWTFGAMDNVMLVRIANRLTNYLIANYPAAVGGITGAEPQAK